MTTLAPRTALPALLVLVLLPCVASCGDSSPDPDEDRVVVREGTRKPAGARRKARPSGGPVDVRAEFLGETTALLHLRFHADAEDVHVQTYGTDGLVVVSEEFPVVGGTVLVNEELAVEVEFRSDGAVAGNLAVLVEGTFAGRRRSVVRTVTVGAARPEEAPAPEVVEVDGGRVRVHRRPAREKKR